MSRKDILLAGAIGDAVGYIVEFYRLYKIQKLYGEDGISLSHVPANAKLYVSDDTQMTLFTLDAVKNIKNYNIIPSKAYVNAFKQWYYTQSGEYDKTVGLASYKSMQDRRAPGNTCLSALYNDAPVATSKGCGGVMRAAPCAFNFTLEESFNEGIKQAAITHGHPSGYLPAGCLAGLIHELEDATNDIGNAIEKMIEELKKHPSHEETLASIELALKLSKNGSPFEDIPIIGEGWTGEEAFGIALYSVLVATNFKDCLSIAINHDGDSDSTGSIAGQLWAAAYGLPKEYKAWESKLDIANAFEYITKNIDELGVENE